MKKQEAMDKAIDITEEYFPKGKDKRRGDALVVGIYYNIWGQEDERERILKLLDKFLKKGNRYYCDKGILHSEEVWNKNDLEELKLKIKEDY